MADGLGSLCARQEWPRITEGHEVSRGMGSDCVWRASVSGMDASAVAGTGGLQLSTRSSPRTDYSRKTRMTWVPSPRSSGGSRWVDLRTHPVSDGKIDGRPNVIGINGERQRTGGPRIEPPE